MVTPPEICADNLESDFLKQIAQFYAANSATQWQQNLWTAFCFNVTFPASDRHGQSVFNPEPCNANQVTTPVRRV